jgi:1-acyl-sn-glycerol-3-phosphate acyltransferase
MSWHFVAVQWEHNFSDDFNGELGVATWYTRGMSQWIFEDQGIDFLEGQGVKWYVAFTDRLSDNLLVYLPEKPDRVILSDYLHGDVARQVIDTGRENLPPEGGFVIASNHLGLVDAFLVHYALNDWKLFVLIGEKWGKNPLFHWVGKHLNFLFIDRFNPDLKAMRETIGRMKAGQVLVIAPEGTRSRTGALIEGKPGGSYLAAKLGYPIVPVAITGTPDRVILDHLKHFRRAPVTVTGGKLFSLSPLPAEGRDQVLQQYTDEIMCRIAALLPEKYRGVYANHPRLDALLRS